MSGRWPRLNDAQRLSWLRLIRTPRIGPATFRDSLNHFGSAQAALDGLPEMTARRGKPLRPPPAGQIEAEMEAAARLGGRFIAVGEEGYPWLLTQSERPPPMLCALIEQLDIADRPAVGIVGSRNASAGGLSLARRMAAELGEAGVAVVSGLARGMDAAAHMGALATGTIAFTAGGLARPYPPEHGDLMHHISRQGGAVYSEMALDWSARAQDFPRRNRLVAASSLGLVVVEAAARSGSLITARQANELGRLVMAVPGFPLDPRSEGPNGLIREGATLVRNCADVLDEVRPLMAQGQHGLPAPGATLLEDGAPDYQSLGEELLQDADGVLESVMGFSAIAVDELIAATGLPTGLVRAWLLENELADRLTRYPGDRFAWKPDA